MKKLFVFLLSILFSLSLVGLIACDNSELPQGEYLDGGDNSVWTDATSDKYFNFTLNEGETYDIALKPDVDLPDVLPIPSTYNQKTVGVISEDAFKASEVKNIVVSSSITEIKDKAFMDCTSLESITFALDSAVEKIGTNVFFGCTALTSVVLPDSITEIGDAIFRGCASLESATLSDNLNSIGEYAFDGCTSFNFTQYDNAYYVGSANNPYYMLVSGIGTTITSCEIHANTVIIGDNSFGYYKQLEAITIPNNVKCIGNYAFCDCDIITTVSIPDSVIKLGESVFTRCDKLATVYIGKGVEKLDYFAFYNCLKLTTVTFASDSNLKEIEYQAFLGDYMLSGITIPATVNRISRQAFKSCSWKMNVSFENTEGWSIANDQTPEDKTPIDVSNPETNSTNLRETYLNYNWTRE